VEGDLNEPDFAEIYFLKKKEKTDRQDAAG
jgi:hypothetical protein